MAHRVKRFAIYFAAGAAAIALLAWAASAASTRLVALAIAAALPSEVREAYSFEVESARWGQIRLTGLRGRDGAPSARSIDLAWSWADLRARRLGALAIEGLALASRPGGASLELGALGPWLAAPADPDAAEPGDDSVAIERIVLRDSVVSLARGGAQALDVALEADLTMAPALAGTLAASWGDSPDDGGSLRIAIDAEGNALVNARARAERATLRALAVTATDGDAPPRALEISASGRASIGRGGSAAEWMSQLERGALEASLDVDVAASDFTVDGAQVERASAAGALAFANERFSIERGELELERSDAPPAHATFAAAGELLPDGRARFEKIELRAARWPFAGGVLGLDVRGSGRASAAEGELALELDASLADVPGGPRHARARGPARLRFTREVVELELARCLELSGAHGPLASGIELASDSSACLTTDEGAPLRVRLLPDGGAISEIALRARASRAALHIADSAFDARDVDLRATAAIDAAGARGTLAARAAALALPDAELALSDVAIESTWEREPALRADATFRVAAIADARRAPRFPALGANGRAQLADGVARFDAALADSARALRGHVAGDHRTASGSGAARIDFEPVDLAAHPELARAVASWLPEASALERGALDLDVALAWGENGLRSSAQIGVERADGSLSGVAVRGLDTALSLASLAPLATSGVQELHFDGADPGIPFGGGTVSFAIERDEVLRIARGEVAIAGGTLAARGHVPLEGGPDQRVDIEVAGIEIARLLELVPVEGLEASGSLVGSITYTVDHGRPVVRGGVLRTVAGGFIRYRPSGDSASGAAPLDTSEMVRSILRDFQYEVLDLSIEGSLDERIDVRATLRGSNPGFQDGHPVHLTLNLTSSFGEAVRATPALARWLERIATPKGVDPEGALRVD